MARATLPWARLFQDGFAVGYATKAEREGGAKAAPRVQPQRLAEDGPNREARRKAAGVKGKSKGAPKAKANTTPLPPPPSGE